MSEEKSLVDFAEDQGTPSERMHALLRALRLVRAEAEERAGPFLAIIEAEQAKMASVIVALDMRETEIKVAIEDCLEHEFELDGFKYKDEIGTALIVRPKNRISYDTKGLEVLRKSSAEVERLIGHLRKEKPAIPYLRVKLTKEEERCQRKT